jgi:hypothetical protein
VADKFYAATRIKYGVDHENEDPTKPAKHETKWFEPGEEVTDVPVEEMKRLWDAGALERREDPSKSPLSPTGPGTGSKAVDEAAQKSSSGSGQSSSPSKGR